MQSLAQLFAIIKVNATVLKNLVIFVPFTGDQEQVSRLQQIHGELNGGTSVFYDDIPPALTISGLVLAPLPLMDLDQTAPHIVENLRRVFAAGVIGGRDRNIGTTGGDRRP